MRHLQANYYQALKDNDLQGAFKEVWKDWNNEQAAMIYAQVVSSYDLLNLTGVISNHRELMELRKRVEVLENKREE